MALKERIPKDFYRLFRTRNVESYMDILVAVYQENNEVYAALGLTSEECLAIISEKLAGRDTGWEKEPDEGELSEAQGAGNDRPEENQGVSASMIFNRLTDWGWLKSDFDEKMNSYVISFPEYSQLFTELFQKLQTEEDGKERESILAIYSALFTYSADPERNNEILKNALQTSRRLSQLLSNMQDGMRAYFDKLSKRKNFIGIQEVLVEEINNSDSRKYAILTTTDSFYRYKEAVKEQICQILNGNDRRKLELQEQESADPLLVHRRKRALEVCEEASGLVYQIEREFDQIERKYQKLIQQKTIFAKRALARVRYILQEGSEEEDKLLQLFRLLDRSPHRETMLAKLRESMPFTASYTQVCDESFYNRREKNNREFQPMVSVETASGRGNDIGDFVPKPLYTRHQLQKFRERNMQEGRFIATAKTVHSMEDLEKLLFLWQEETEQNAVREKITLGEEIRTSEGFTFSGLTIEEEPHV